MRASGRLTPYEEREPDDATKRAIFFLRTIALAAVEAEDRAAVGAYASYADDAADALGPDDGSDASYGAAAPFAPTDDDDAFGRGPKPRTGTSVRFGRVEPDPAAVARARQEALDALQHAGKRAMALTTLLHMGERAQHMLWLRKQAHDAARRQAELMF